MPFEAFFLQGVVTWHVDPKFQESISSPIAVENEAFLSELSHRSFVRLFRPLKIAK